MGRFRQGHGSNLHILCDFGPRPVQFVIVVCHEGSSEINVPRTGPIAQARPKLAASPSPIGAFQFRWNELSPSHNSDTPNLETLKLKLAHMNLSMVRQWAHDSGDPRESVSCEICRPMSVAPARVVVLRRFLAQEHSLCTSLRPLALRRQAQVVVVGHVPLGFTTTQPAFALIHSLCIDEQAIIRAFFQLKWRLYGMVPPGIKIVNKILE